MASLVADMHDAGLRKQTIRKTVSVLAMVLDHGRVLPNPARDRLTVRLPREERRHVEPPSADHVEAVARLLLSRYRLPLLVLDATGMRVGELEALSWGDLDEPRGRWRIATSKTGRPRWVTLRRGKRVTELRRDIAELRDRIEYLEDSVAAFVARAERDERTLRPWVEVRRRS